MVSQNFIEVPDHFDLLAMPSSLPQKDFNDQYSEAIKQDLENITDKSKPIIFPGRIFVEDRIPKASKEEFAKKIEKLIKDGYQPQ